MPKIPTIAEQKLADLQPNKLDEDFMSRLLASTEGSLTDLTAAESEFEASLRKFAPQKLSAAYDSAIINALQDTPFHMDEKIVLFHKSASRGEKKPSKLDRLNLAAAAAVALLGAMAALITTPTQQMAVENTTPGQEVRSPLNITPSPNSFAPAAFNRNLSDTRDEGVIWNQENLPHRVLRFTYTERVTLKNKKGESIQVEQPREEFVIIPEKID